MFFEPRTIAAGSGPASLTIEDLLAVKPSHLRGRLGPGNRGPDGERPGRGRAQSFDFDGLSPYEPGDDVRSIDWRASLRTGETIARRYAAASHRARMIVLDIGPEMHFGTVRQVMAKTAALTAGWLAWSALALNEPVGFLSGGAVLPPRRGRRHVLRILERTVAVFDASRENATDAPDLEAASAMIGLRDEVCLVGEVPVPHQPVVDAGRSLSARRVLQFYLVEDPVSRAPIPAGRYPVRGPDGVRTTFDIKAGRSPEADAKRALGDAGWRIVSAWDLLPRGSG